MAQNTIIPAMPNTPRDRSFTGQVVVDPVTRIEGHLRIEVEIENGVISNARSMATLFRGLEIILKGRDPRDAQHFTQRTCGVCTYVHALASTRAVDNAVGAQIPDNATSIRKLVLAAQCMHDHIVHFYSLHALDFVDIVSALSADPVKAAKLSETMSNRPATSEELIAVRDRLRKFVDSGQLGPFTNAYFLGGHEGYYLEPEMNLIAASHYLEALRVQVKLARAIAAFGAKHPHPQFTIVGGVSCYDALRPERIEEFRALIQEGSDFINNAYIPDLLAIASAYKDWSQYGATDNFMTFGEYAQSEHKPETQFFKQGIIYNRDLSNIGKLDPDSIKEHVRYSWFEGEKAYHPYEGQTVPEYTGDASSNDRYSWSKAPRYKDLAMETGPLAQVLVAYAQGNKDVVDTTNMVLNSLGVGQEALFSTLGRTAARGIEAAVISKQINGWLDDLSDNVGRGDKDVASSWTMPKNAEGVGFVSAPRGGLSHWIRIKDRKIENFQLVVPSTWNLGPRCSNGTMSPVEQALVGTPVADPSRPVEILRTVHSFDPCMACAVHVIDPVNNSERVFKIL